VSWLAAARALRGNDHADYAVTAFAQALHDTLAAQVPSQQASLDSSLAATLASVPDGPAKKRGIAGRRPRGVGHPRRACGRRSRYRLGRHPWTPPPAAPSVFQLTPPVSRPAIRAGQGNARPFLLKRKRPVRPRSPLRLDSPKYQRALAEVEYIGATNSPRTAEQTEVANFWYPAVNFAYVQITRAVLADTSYPLSWQARFVAAFNVITTDAQISIYNAKYKYLFWRPLHRDHHRQNYLQDPTWTSFWAAPQHPEYPSGHGGQVGSQQGVLDAFLGPRAPAPIPLSSPTRSASPAPTPTGRRSPATSSTLASGGRALPHLGRQGFDQGLRVARWEVGRLAEIGL